MPEFTHPKDLSTVEMPTKMPNEPVEIHIPHEKTRGSKQNEIWVAVLSHSSYHHHQIIFLAAFDPVVSSHSTHSSIYI